MKERILKLISILTVICLLTSMLVPSLVKSAQAVVSDVSNTWHGIGNTDVYTASVNGYSNLYCANGGAPLNNGTVLNDNGISMYDSKAVASITSSHSALCWILDNMYLTDVTDSNTKNAMKNNLKNAIKTYSKYKDSNGNSILSQKIGVSNIDDDWINTAVNSLINDKITLFATQQYAIWHYVKNNNSAYNNAMQNSDGSYNAMPGANADKTYYTALYISLVGLADNAQTNGYTSPNINGDINIKLENAGEVKTTIQSDGKTALVGPYKLTNNSLFFGKSFSATVNSETVDKIETVDKDGKSISVSSRKDSFYVKVTYNKGFSKGVKYNFKINVKISGYKTFALLLTPADNYSQPLMALRKEAISTNSSAEASYFEELNGNYSLVLEKVDSKDPNKKIPGVTFKVKEGNNDEKAYGPTDMNGLATVFKNKEISKEDVVEYTITEVDVGDNEYISLKDDVKFYITLSKTENAYIASKVSFEKDKQVDSKEVTLQDNTKVTVSAKITDNTVKITIPNKFDLKGKYSLILEKVDSTNSHIKLEGVSFKVKEENGEAQVYGPTSSAGTVAVFKDREIKEKGIKEFTITEIDLGNNEYIKIKDEIKVYITISEQDDILVASQVSFEKDKQTLTKEVTLEDNSKTIVTTQIYGSKVLLTIPNKPVLKGKYSLELEKVDSEDNNEKISGVTFKVRHGNEEKIYGPTNENGIVSVVKNNEVKQESVEEYEITEINVGNNKYVKLNDSIKIYIKIIKTETAYIPSQVSFEKDTVVTEKEIELEDGTKVKVTSQISGNTVKVTIPNKKAEFDLALRKFITKINNEKLENDRQPVIRTKDASAISINGTALYNNPKDPIKVKEGDTVTYTIRIYNEGNIDGYAKEIVDFLPDGLEFVENSEINKANEWTASKNEDGTTVVKTNKLANTLIPASNGTVGYLKLAIGLNVTDENWVDFWKDVEIECKVKENVEKVQTLCNVAEISNYGYMDGDNYIEADKIDVDRDSEQDNVFGNKDEIQNAIDDYYKVQYTDKNNTDRKQDNYPGRQDDDDFENLIVEPEIKGNYSLELEKVDSEDNNKKISGVTFKVKQGEEEKTYGPTDESGIVSIVHNKEVKQECIEEYTITEVNVENNKYVKLNDAIKIYITISKTDTAYMPSKVSFDKDHDVTTKEVELEDATKVTITSEISGNTVKITIQNRKAEFDLALRKFITKINNEKLENDRQPVIRTRDASAILKDGTALYNNPKDPVKVKEGDTVTYTIRVYNEGNIDGYAKEIVDYLPNGLEFVENSEINRANKWTASKNEDGTTVVKTSKLAETVIPASNGATGYQKLALGLNETDENWVDFWKDVEIECKIKENVGKEQKLSNVAEITNYGYMDGDTYIEADKIDVDRDSEQDNVFGNKDEIQNAIDDYYKVQYTDKNNTDRKQDNYPGRQDDDDYENLIVEPILNEFEFVLNKVDEQGNPLIGADFTVKREKDDSIDVLLDNEEVKGTYEVLENNVQVNKTYTYRVMEVESAPEYVNVMEGKYVTLRVYMNEQKELILGNYEKVEEEEYLINTYGFIINKEDGTIVKEDETDLYQKIKVMVNNQVVPAKVEITIPNALIEKEFDLALRKFITEIRTGVGSKNEQKQEITDRVPVFRIDEDGNYIYEHTKEPLIVVNDNVVVYTLRVYNEGEVDGYAKQIKDDIPEGLEFLPLYSLNEEYRWVMLDKYGKETNEVESAVSIVSDYLSKEQEEVPGENLIKAFDIEKYEAGEVKEPHYKEVKVAFKVNTDPKSEEIIINQAQISDDSDSDGNEVTDKDSEPDKWIEGEDDQDIEKVKVQYFDLSLRKWVTKAIIIENGQQTITETGHEAEDDPEEIVKVDLNKSKIDDVTVKFEYSIRVKNEGKIAGYAKEISDYIPEGLKFVKEDNPYWDEVDGKVVTTVLKDTLLNPGDMAEVSIILTWINSENNMGLKVNTAEISKDYNEYGTPDIDSTPDNKVPGEDDIDDAPVMLTVKTGQSTTYIGITGVVLLMLASGVVLIKRYVLN